LQKRAILTGVGKMRKIFYPLIALFIFFGSVQASANRIDDFNFKNYIYDDDGNPVFIKIYIKSSTEILEQNKANTLPLQQLINRMAQDDQRGSYIVIPIKKKKHKEEDDDKDESTWECPYCGRTNKASSHYCETKDCVLHR